jgi:hypothetical protein
MKLSTAEQQAYDHLLEESKQHLPPEEQGKTTSEQKLKGQLFRVLNHYFETGQYLKIRKIFDTLFPSYTHKVLLDEEQTPEQRKNAYEKLLQHIEEQSNFIDRKTILNTLSGKTKAQEKTKNILAICYGNATSFQDYCKILESKQQIIIVAPEVLEKTENVATEAPEVLEKTENAATEAPEILEKTDNAATAAPLKQTKSKEHIVLVELKTMFGSYRNMAIIMVGLFILLFITIITNITKNTATDEPEVDKLTLYETVDLQAQTQAESLAVDKNKPATTADTLTEKPQKQDIQVPKQSRKEDASQTSLKKAMAVAPKETTDVDSVSLQIEAVTLLPQPGGLPKFRFAIKNHGTGAYILTGLDLKVLRARGATGSTDNENTTRIKVINNWEVLVPDETGTKNYRYSINKFSTHQIKNDVVFLDLLFYHADKQGNKYELDAYDMYATIWAGDRAKIVSKMFKFVNNQLIYDGKPIKVQ